MTFLEFKTAVRRNAFPEGEARNLRSRNDNLILDGLVDLQRDLPRVSRRQYTTVRFTDTAFSCGTTIVQKPQNSFVKRIYTHVSDNHCDAVFYRFVSRVDLENEKKRSNTCGCQTIGEPDISAIDDPANIVIGEVNSAAEFDKDWRAATGIYSIVEDRIYLFPHINSDETIVIEWSGVRYEFADVDLVAWDRDVQNAIELYLRSNTALRDTASERDYAAFEQKYRSLKADLIIRDRNEEWGDTNTPEECCSPYQIFTQGSTDGGTNGGGGGGGTGEDGNVTGTCGVKIFNTVQEMLESNKFSWCQAVCINYNEGDRFITNWIPINGSDLPQNGGDILQTLDGRLIVRTYVREHFGEEIIIPPPTDAPYNIASILGFDSIDQFRKSKSLSQIVILAAEIDGDGGGDANGDGGMFGQGGNGVDDGINEVINSIGIHYRRMAFK